MSTQQNEITVHSIVTFRPDFSAKLTGIKFIVEAATGAVDKSNGRELVSLKVLGKSAFRLAYADDLILSSN